MATMIGDHSVQVSGLAFAPVTQPRASQAALCGLSLLAADLAVATTAALLGAMVMDVAWSPSVSAPETWHFPVPYDLVALFVVTIVYLAFKGRYTQRVPFWTETRLVVTTTLWAAFAAFLHTQLAPVGTVTGEMCWVPLLVLLSFPAAATAANGLTKRLLLRAGLWSLPVVVIGDGPTATEAERAFETDRSLGYRFVGRIDPASLIAEPVVPQLQALLRSHQAKSLLIAVDVDADLQRRVIECALRERIPFAFVPPPRAFPTFGGESTYLLSQDTMVLSFRNPLSSRMSRILKAGIDVVGAAILLGVLWPLFLILAIIIRLDGGPAIFAHRRVGIQMQSFHCLKFRTMVIDSDRVLHEVLARDPVLAAEWQATRKLSRDPRVTPIGRFLRKTSLDELPQLINVLRLEMSLVGPRPIVESEVPLYGEYIAHYCATRPGMTGLWQVSGRSNTSYTRRVQLDVWYVNNWSVWHDIAVLLKTIPAVMRREGAC